MAPYIAADHHCSSDADVEVDDILYGAPHQYFDHEVMAQWASNNANNLAQTEQDLEYHLRRFLGQYEEDSPHASTTAQAHAPGTTPATMVATTPTVLSTAASAYDPPGRPSTPLAMSAMRPTRTPVGSIVAGLASWRSLDTARGLGGHHEQNLQAHDSTQQAPAESLEAQKRNLDAWALHVGDMKRVKEQELSRTAERLDVREPGVRKREKALMRREKRLVRTCLRYRDAYKMMNSQCGTLDAIIAEQAADKAEQKELSVKQKEDEYLKRMQIPH